MSWQEISAFALVGLAVAYLAARRLSRWSRANCCGGKECPAAAATVRKLRGGPRAPS